MPFKAPESAIDSELDTINARLSFPAQALL